MHITINYSTTCWRIASVVLMTLGLGWIVYILYQALSKEELQNMTSLAPGWLVITIGLLIVCVFLKSVMMLVMLESAANARIPLLKAVKLHVLGQVVRYLPGRFWGLVYQISSARGQISASALTRANVDLMVLGLIGNLAVAVFLLGLTGVMYLPGAIGLAVLIASVMLFIFRSGISTVFASLANFGPVKFRQLMRSLSATRLSWRDIMYITLVSLVSWILYLLAWQLLARVFPTLAGIDFVALCAWYTIAWIIGFVSLITPAGLGIREAVFVLTGSLSASTTELAMMAVFVRVWLLIGDLAAAIPVLWLPAEDTEHEG